MIEQLLTEHLDTWTQAVETKSAAGRGSSKKLKLHGIAKLRELILELAVRGQLVPQDESDEPASVLLERIAVERERLVKEKKIRKLKRLPEISEEEKPFELPENWTWARFSDVYDVRDGTHDSPKQQQTGYPLVTSKNLYTGVLNFTDVKYISEEDHKKVIERSKVDRGDILFAMIGSIGNPVIVDTDVEFSIKNVALFKYYKRDLSEPSYLKLFLELAAVVLKRKSSGGVQPFVSLGKLRSFVICLPPLDEQKRIVAKVDELMALCDALERGQESSIAAHEVLVENLLAALTNAADKGEFKQAWARVAEHFDTLFTTERSVDQLKQTILQLAVMGKLVEQDPTDEPAGGLLKRIAAEKARLVKEKKIKKQKVLPEIGEEEKVFELPVGWVWCRFGSLVNFKAELVRPETFQELDQIGPDLIEKGTGNLIGRRTVKESGIKGPNSKFYKGQILYSKIRPSLSKAVITEFDGLCSADMYPLESLVEPHFLLKVILSEVFLEQVRAAENRIKMPKLNIDSLSNIVVPICSESEQNRIAARVSELLIFCDRLKSNIRKAQSTQLLVSDALTDLAVG